ncbi:DNA/RNA helicase, DEAD/DEAH box type, N-terminal domain and Helicase, superfamily 1/2, ATP-binding domain and P-loop containing nucleoside triphosphate hydrolase domain-containing protein [Strongyloides ratti]|uniref:DNA/RNA helicase, DEAD/DEAH box type, N-terminal domain and Helicase, superfamily 1/2, ATP-binding domain and P-loop containing nucleoside triphosphate hydrolase domain-containing protein n=1 Tax=Strongyloides ratti TaxID=34506 RepID=A0A090MT23_STRRB|nr:DNA/RNA helicase, DEAD/DEAH box type, N-terminal domain and Helicase, superfamily 1/2, ATP-binding domain and P-loop containing nucleoside triphosphate hydrolase domain-containing protein [Strongyloides ratti]CEF61468.1 DNA/RNA helicase, DEAD/DEAH box type, N-terminal domain and Helicase, superfamily 1/2, ATP-binding domain and P-loop containing nucleoside triphosphate hydrolase domain-containing protein [Strongyloides ratti]
MLRCFYLVDNTKTGVLFVTGPIYTPYMGYAHITIAELNDVTIIILPTILLCNQCDEILKKSNVNHCIINSESSKEDKREILKLAIENTSKFSNQYNCIICTPDSFISDYCRNIISCIYKHDHLKRIIIDESHLVLHHGLSFRPNFMKLLSYLHTLKGTQILYSSATLSPNKAVSAKNGTFGGQRLSFGKNLHMAYLWLCKTSVTSIMSQCGHSSATVCSFLSYFC